MSTITFLTDISAKSIQVSMFNSCYLVRVIVKNSRNYWHLNITRMLLMEEVTVDGTLMYYPDKPDMKMAYINYD